MASYRFTLRTPDTTTVFGSEFVSNWQDIRTSLVKNEKYKGLFREFTSTIEFTGRIRRLLVQTIDTYGVDSEVFLTIESGNDNKDNWSFKVLSSDMRAEMKDYENMELDFLLEFTDNTLAAKIQSRDEISMNLNATKSIDGDQLPELDMLRSVFLHDRKIIFNSKFEKQIQSDFVVLTQPTALTDAAFLTIPTNFFYRSGDFIQNVFPSIASLNIQDRALHSILHASTFAGKINLKGNVKGAFYFPPPGAPELQQGFFGLTGSFNWDVAIRVRFSEPRDGLAGELIKTLATGSAISVSNTVAQYDANFDETFEIQEGDSITISMFINPIAGDPVTFQAHIFTEEIDYDLIFRADFEGTASKIVLLHDAFEKILQIITGQAGIFYSESMGRSEIGYDQEGDLAWIGIANGKMIRGFPYNGDEESEITESPLNLSFEWLFRNLSKIYNLSGEIVEIDGRQRFRIDPVNKMRSNNVITKLNLTEGVSRTPDFEKIYTSVRVGYRDQEYEETNGLYASNGEFIWTVPFSGEGNEMDLVSELRTDDIGVELTRRNQFKDDPFKDYRSDSDIFLFVCNEPGVPPPGASQNLWQNAEAIFKNATGEPYLLTLRTGQTISGTYDVELAYNVEVNPRENLLRHGGEIRACIINKVDKNLNYSKGSYNPELIYDVGSGSKKLNDDISVSLLSLPNELIDIIMIQEGELSLAQWDDILNNKGGLLHLHNKGIDIFCRAKLIDFDNNKKTANFELIRVNL